MAEEKQQIRRRTVLQSAGAAGFSFLGSQAVSATDLTTTTHFVEQGWSFDVDFPEGYNIAKSIHHIDEPNFHSVDTDEQRIYLTPVAPQDVVTQFESLPRVVFADGYRKLPTQPQNPGAKRFENGILPVELGADTRRTHGIPLIDSPSLTRPTISVNGTTLDVATPNQSRKVESGTKQRFDFPERTITIEERIPASDSRNINDTAAPMFTEHEATVAPQLILNNHGELEVHSLSREGDA